MKPIVSLWYCILSSFLQLQFERDKRFIDAVQSPPLQSDLHKQAPTEATGPRTKLYAVI